MKKSSNAFESKVFSRWNVAAISWWSLWDEWKWKATSYFKSVDYVAVSVWGANAGHTVYYDDSKLVLHELPWGAIIEGAKVYCWQWRVINIKWMNNEISDLSRAWVDMQCKIIIAWNAQLIFDNLQKKLDGHIEELKWRWSVWTTKKWIGPAYALKALRTWINVNTLLRASRKQLKDLVSINKKLFKCLNADALYTEIMISVESLCSLIDRWIVTIDETNMHLAIANEKLKRILVEISQSSLLAIDWGMYPYCTSSDTSVNWVCSALNIPKVHYHIMVLKAIKSKVWGWFFPTKFPDQIANIYREISWEFGATTGRPRDVGWFDAVETRAILLRQVVDAIFLTKVDMLNQIPQVKIGEKYIAWDESFSRIIPSVRDYKDLVVKYSRKFDIQWDITWLTDRDQLPKSYEEYLNYLKKTLKFNGELLVWTWPKSQDSFVF